MADFNNTTPAAPSSAYRLGKWQKSGRNSSVYVPRRPDLDFTGGLWGMRPGSNTDGQDFAPYGNANAGLNTIMPCPMDGYIRSMRARISTTQINGKTVSLALFRTVVQTNLIITVPPLAPVGNYANDHEVVSLRRGELFGFTLDVIGVAAGSVLRNVSGEYTSTDNSSMIGWSGNLTVPINTIHYAALGSNVKGATESEFEIKIGFACTAKNLFLRTGATQPASGSLVVTLRKNGAATALTLTVNASQAAGPYADLTNSVALVAGDRITVEFDNNATLAVSATIQAITLSITPTSATLPSIVPAQANTTLVGTVTNYYNLFNALVAAPGNTDEIAYPMPRAGTLGDFKVQGGTAGNAGSTIVWELYKNGIATGYKKTLGGAVATAWFDADAGSAIHFDLNDLAWVQVSHTGVGTDPIYNICFSFTPDLA